MPACSRRGGCSGTLRWPSPELGKPGGPTRPSHCEPRLPARVYEQALQFSADDILQHLLVERGIRHELAELIVLVLELLQPAHIRWQHAVLLLLPVEVGRLADPGPAADVRDGTAVHTLLQDERHLRVIKLRCLDRFSLLPAK